MMIHFGPGLEARVRARLHEQLEKMQVSDKNDFKLTGQVARWREHLEEMLLSGMTDLTNEDLRTILGEDFVEEHDAQRMVGAAMNVAVATHPATLSTKAS